MNGKGDRYRPVDKDKFNDNWDLIFNSKPVAEGEQNYMVVDSTIPFSLKLNEALLKKGITRVEKLLEVEEESK